MLQVPPRAGQAQTLPAPSSRYRRFGHVAGAHPVRGGVLPLEIGVATAWRYVREAVDLLTAAGDLTDAAAADAFSDLIDGNDYVSAI
jgi:hypothetical protein